jgi:hypothetical protein
VGLGAFADSMGVTHDWVNFFFFEGPKISVWGLSRNKNCWGRKLASEVVRQALALSGKALVAVVDGVVVGWSKAALV